jgi:hypothetical protein
VAVGIGIETWGGGGCDAVDCVGTGRVAIVGDDPGCGCSDGGRVAGEGLGRGGVAAVGWARVDEDGVSRRADDDGVSERAARASMPNSVAATATALAANAQTRPRNRERLNIGPPGGRAPSAGEPSAGLRALWCTWNALSEPNSCTAVDLATVTGNPADRSDGRENLTI